jgi:hypothetical protein
MAGTGILFARVGLTAQTELAARVLPRLALTIPVETKLRQLLPNFGGGLFLERHPNPLANHLGQPIRDGQLRVQQVQHLRCRQRPVLFPGCGVNRQAVVFLLDWRVCVRCFRCCGVVVCCAQLFVSSVALH